jgi:hypothetical protein
MMFLVLKRMIRRISKNIMGVIVSIMFYPQGKKKIKKRLTDSGDSVAVVRY